MLRGLLTGLKITAKYLFRKPITVNYPEEKPFIPPRWRGRIVLTSDPSGEERCVACYLCQAVSGPGKHPEYSFWQVSGVALDGKKAKGEAINEKLPTNYRSNMP
jgi:hypothetical protein